MADDESKQSQLSGRRFSRSGETSRAEELRRIRALSPLDRMALALALGRRHKALIALGQDNSHE